MRLIPLTILILLSNFTFAQLGEIVINEIMASNTTTQADQDGEFDDWVELYNNGSNSVDLSGSYLSDNEMELMKWEFPAGSTIEGNGYLIVWFDNDEEQSGLHTSFKLSAGGEAVFLVDDSSNILDSITFGEQTTDISFGRYPNGVGDFQTMSSTFNATNSTPLSVRDLFDVVSYSIIPNPASRSFQIKFDGLISEELPLRIYDMNGQVIANDWISNTKEINCANWPVGNYLVKIGSSCSNLSKY